MSNLVKHAKREFLALGYKPIDESEDDPNKWIQENVLELLEVFGEQGHSGSSAPYCIEMFQKLADFKPLSPITCLDFEWNDVSNRGEREMYQNNRLSSVFKDGNGQPYYLNAIVWKNQDGHTYTGSALDNKGAKITSRQNIRLPFTPKTFYIDIVEEEIAKDDWEFYVKNDSDLDKVWEYYDRKE